MSKIKILNLFRCYPAEEIQKSSDEKIGMNYFVTDYFDEIIVEDLDPQKTNFSECMGIKQEANQKKGISHQRYCLYSETDSENEEIFDNQEEYPILMVIQLFMNPNIYQVDCFEDGSKLSIKECMSRLEDCIRNYLDVSNKVIWKIYQLVSAGDLAIIVRSRKVHDAYNLCSLVRSIRLSAGETGKEEAVFYSYSICGVLDCSLSDTENRGLVKWKDYLEENDRVVLRIQYAQEFREYDQKNLSLKRTLLTNGEHLLGRYDHQMICNPEEFQELYPYLKKYKFSSTDLNISENELKKITHPVVQTLLKMMSRRYIAYMNERLLLKYDKDPILEDNFTEKWKLELKSECNSSWISLNIINGQKIEKIQEQVIELEKRIRPYYPSARNLKEYTRLLGRLCRVFYEINKLQELQISVAHLLVQYEDMIASLEELLGMIVSEPPKIYADIIEENLKHGIGALEIFTRYIRNVNLQTFQAPNYDLQTNMCVEKILLAYSQFLRPFMLQRKKTYYLSESLYPIILPSMRVTDLSVVVIFDNRKTGIFNGQKERLMVVYSPTFSFLCESCFLIPSVFHEIAHQFRYEERNVRNTCLNKYVLKSFLHALIIGILDKSGEYDFQNTSVVEELVEYAYDKFYKNFLDEQKKELCLQEFKQELIEKLDMFYKCLSEENKTPSKLIKRYVAKTKGDIQYYGKKILRVLSKVARGIDSIEWIEKAIVAGKEVDKGKLEKQREKLRKDIKKLKKIQENQIWMEIKKELEKSRELELKEKFEKLLKQQFGETDSSEEIGKKAFEIWNEYIEKQREMGQKSEDGLDKGRIFHLLKQYHNVNSAYCFLSHHMRNSLNMQQEEWLNYRKRFNEMCNALFNEFQIRLGEFSVQRREKLDWNMVAVPIERLNYIIKEIQLRGEEGFKEKIQAICEEYWSNGIYDFVSQKIELYREITSDLFMCAIMNLDPFGYLVVVAEMLKFNEFNRDVQMERVSIILQCLYEVENKGKTNLKTWRESLEVRMKEEMKTLCEKITIVVKNNDNQLTDIFQDKNLKFPPETMDEILYFFENFPKEIPLLSVQKWIIRIYWQIAVVISKAVQNKECKDIIGTKEIWKDIISGKDYYSVKKELQEVLKESKGEELCQSIREILNSPAQFFAERKALLPQEILFILSQYEESCKTIFQRERGEINVTY